MKTCWDCGESLPLAAFYPSKRDGYQARCRRCCLAYSRANYNPDYYRRKHLRKTYGITVERYDEMLEAQGGGCAICLGTDERKNLAVDHDADTGAVRALLCAKCNQGLGMFDHKPHLLREAAEYLEFHMVPQSGLILPMEQA